MSFVIPLITSFLVVLLRCRWKLNATRYEMISLTVSFRFIPFLLLRQSRPEVKRLGHSYNFMICVLILSFTLSFSLVPPLRPCCYFRSFSHNKSSQQCCNHNACILHTQFSTTSIDYSYFCYIGMSTHSLCVCGRLFSVQMLYMSMKHVYFKHPHIYSFTLTRK